MSNTNHQVFTARVSREQFVSSYLKLWTGSVKFSKLSLDLTKLILNKYLELEDSGINEPYLSELSLSQDSMNNYRTELNISKQKMYNLKYDLKTLKVIITKNGKSCINPVFIPRLSVTFKYEIV